jgi:putative transcriptional regulator
MSLIEQQFPLRDARERAGMTQDGLAELAGITRRFVSQLEREKQEPRVVTAIKVARALNTTVEDLFGHLVGGE